MSKTARDVIAGVKNEVVYPPESLDGSMVDAIIAALDAAGFVIVPKEPTPEMIEAGAEVDNWCVMEGQAAQPEVYRAMIAAAQETKS